MKIVKKTGVKLWKHICVHFLLLLTLLCVEGRAQNFTNLDFESATVERITPGSSLLLVPSAFPGWLFSESSIYDPLPKGGPAVAFYDVASTGAGGMSLFDLAAPSGMTPIDGNYSLGFATGGVNRVGFGLGQEGFVPAGTKTLLIAVKSSETPNIEVSLSPVLQAGNPILKTISNIPLVPVETLSDYTIYGVDISAAAGSDAHMSIAFESPTDSSVNQIEVDDISFSDQSIGAPDSNLSLAMTAAVFGTMLFLGNKWKLSNICGN